MLKGICSNIVCIQNIFQMSSKVFPHIWHGIFTPQLHWPKAITWEPIAKEPDLVTFTKLSGATFGTVICVYCCAWPVAGVLLRGNVETASFADKKPQFSEKTWASGKSIVPDLGALRFYRSGVADTNQTMEDAKLERDWQETMSTWEVPKWIENSRSCKCFMERIGARTQQSKANNKKTSWEGRKAVSTHCHFILSKLLYWGCSRQRSEIIERHPGLCVKHRPHQHDFLCPKLLTVRLLTCHFSDNEENAAPPHESVSSWFLSKNIPGPMSATKRHWPLPESLLQLMWALADQGLNLQGKTI